MKNPILLFFSLFAMFSLNAMQLSKNPWYKVHQMHAKNGRDIYKVPVALQSVKSTQPSISAPTQKLFNDSAETKESKSINLSGDLKDFIHEKLEDLETTIQATNTESKDSFIQALEYKNFDLAFQIYSADIKGQIDNKELTELLNPLVNKCIQNKDKAWLTSVIPFIPENTDLINLADLFYKDPELAISISTIDQNTENQLNSAKKVGNTKILKKTASKKFTLHLKNEETIDIPNDHPLIKKSGTIIDTLKDEINTPNGFSLINISKTVMNNILALLENNINAEDLDINALADMIPATSFLDMKSNQEKLLHILTQKIHKNPKDTAKNAYFTHQIEQWPLHLKSTLERALSQITLECSDGEFTVAKNHQLITQSITISDYFQDNQKASSIDLSTIPKKIMENICTLFDQKGILELLSINNIAEMIPFVHYLEIPEQQKMLLKAVIENIKKNPEEIANNTSFWEHVKQWPSNLAQKVSEILNKPISIQKDFFDYDIAMSTMGPVLAYVNKTRTQVVFKSLYSNQKNKILDLGLHSNIVHLSLSPNSNYIAVARTSGNIEDIQSIEVYKISLTSEKIEKEIIFKFNVSKTNNFGFIFNLQETALVLNYHNCLLLDLKARSSINISEKLNLGTIGDVSFSSDGNKLAILVDPNSRSFTIIYDLSKNESIEKFILDDVYTKITFINNDKILLTYCVIFPDRNEKIIHSDIYNEEGNKISSCSGNLRCSMYSSFISTFDQKNNILIFSAPNVPSQYFVQQEDNTLKKEDGDGSIMERIYPTCNMYSNLTQNDGQPIIDTLYPPRKEYSNDKENVNSKKLTLHISNKIFVNSLSCTELLALLNHMQISDKEQLGNLNQFIEQTDYFKQFFNRSNSEKLNSLNSAISEKEIEKSEKHEQINLSAKKTEGVQEAKTTKGYSWKTKALGLAGVIGLPLLYYWYQNK